MGRRLVPVNGCWVRRDGPNRAAGKILAQPRDRGSQVLVEWLDEFAREWVPYPQLRSGFKIGMAVQDMPRFGHRKALGEGVVIEVRRLGGRDQVLVEFPEIGERVWLPYENLSQIRAVEHSFALGLVEGVHEAERLRLRCLANALETWNLNTGCLSRLEVDPLPHQIHLVHHILASGNLNWMIADDVGLGKTIEVGMLLAALQARQRLRRVLLVTPAGLVRQWQEELASKFGMDDFEIYGTDFEVNHPRQWKMHDHVIGSLDRLKGSPHLEKLMLAGDWDLVVFDEAHRLSRRQWGFKFDAADRFKLAVALRKRTSSMLLLSGTPHQGMEDKFQALMELVRPDLLSQIRILRLNPEILSNIVIRNRKADVTDAAGNFIFKGKTVRTIDNPVSGDEQKFDTALQDYVSHGYRAAAQGEGQTGRAIGFVMTIYRKLAASSLAAIEAALSRRLTALKSRRPGAPGTEDEEYDDRFGGEREELAVASGGEFFTGELEALADLATRARELRERDSKVKTFLHAVPSLLGDGARSKLLVFTEYRGTQAHLSAALRRIYGQDAISEINGSMSFAEREEAIAKFESQAQFLISTEAGGEGLNLHRECHTMVNYDLPWNPMRLVQRVGRLYRYGQRHRVVVLNLHSSGTIDTQILTTLYQRINAIVQDMAAVSDEFSEALQDDILGEFADLLDVEQILEEATAQGVVRTEKRIEEALQRAREAAELQRDLFRHAAGFDPDEAAGELSLGDEHVRAFVEGMLPLLDIEVVTRLHGDRMLDLRLPETVSSEIGISRTRVRLGFDRDLCRRFPDSEVADFRGLLFPYLVRRAKAYEFGGQCAAVTYPEGDVVAFVAADLCWQNEQGARMRREFASVEVSNASYVLNSERFSEWLASAASHAVGVPKASGTANIALAEPLLELVNQALDERLGAASNRELHPEQRRLAAAAWCGGSNGGEGHEVEGANPQRPETTDFGR
ncbi:MAG: DEAD/DEAH box helicase [Candidatus Eisenbacteria bacterium]|nr:DEAD/DEAH box helicase [Candidatus Eisenbacteria bacterium]